MWVGQHNDARMNVALATTAACYGATVANHCEVIELTKDDKGMVNGAKLRDNISGDEWNVKAKVNWIICNVHTFYLFN
jgi:glycerol-3-phosphate dehydrogenase